MIPMEDGSKNNIEIFCRIGEIRTHVLSVNKNLKIK
jgi:hypothetical protein